MPTVKKLTDLGNEERFIEHHGENVRYCSQNKKWLYWDSHQWIFDEMCSSIIEKARATVRFIHIEANGELDPDDPSKEEILEYALKSEGIGKTKAMIGLAQTFFE